ncbi:MAG: cyclase family protein [Lentisphaeria bacterium]|nr:cyclase family protein [Lentisphaeria bacterium]
MSVIDLSCAFPPGTAGKIRLREVPLRSDRTAYTGMVYDFEVNSMDGSYIDLPGHIRETDDGQRADNVPVENFYRVPCSVIRLNRTSGSGAVTAAELERAFGGKVTTPALMINALDPLDPDEIDLRSVWLDFSALDWMIACGIRLLVSDIYESKALDGVFLKLFQAGISTVCEPRGMNRIRGKIVELTVLFPKIATLTQIPCRILVDDTEA